jgi:hypothetical protein
MDELTRRNLSDSLVTAAENLAGLARDVMTAKLEDPGMADQLAALAERCGDDCREAGRIVRNSVAARRVAVLPPRRIPRDAPGVHRTPRDRS